jgi:transcriptional regulator with XRE-family HTH domain
MYKKLRGKIVEKYLTTESFATHIKVSRASVSNKLNGKTGFTKQDIILWASALDIPQEDYLSYFFTEELNNV